MPVNTVERIDGIESFDSVDSFENEREQDDYKDNRNDAGDGAGADGGGGHAHAHGRLVGGAETQHEKDLGDSAAAQVNQNAFVGRGVKPKLWLRG